MSVGIPTTYRFGIYINISKRLYRSRLLDLLQLYKSTTTTITLNVDAGADEKGSHFHCLDHSELIHILDEK